MSAASLPVLMYHYVSRFTGPINVTPEHFEAQCRGMAAHGWRGIGLDEAEAYLKGEAPLAPRAVLITFDDGFLDNYVYAWPILQKYGHKGVVFAVTERLEHNSQPRPTLADVWQKTVAPAALPPVDAPLARHDLGYTRRNDVFMSWSEAARMEHSGVMRIAAHTARHLAIFAGPEWPRPTKTPDDDSLAAASARFHVPGRRGNTFYRLEGDVPWGMPRFDERPAMSGPAFLPSPELVAAIRHMVPQETAEAYAFFQQPDRVAALRAMVEGYAPAARGRMESEQETRSRMRAELHDCAQTLRAALGRAPTALCWPWGQGCALARAEAQALGYSVFFETAPGANPPGTAPGVRRFKVRDKGWGWLRARLAVYSRPWLAGLYARIKSK